MAIFHLTAKIISRGKGQNSIASAAYRSGEELFDEQAGLQKSHKSRADRIVFTDIMAPQNAPEWVHNRNSLWNEVERSEKRKDAQLAREIEVALPHELTAKQREWLVKDFAREAFVRKGYVVDIAIHVPEKGKDVRNHHAHIMVTRRTVGPEGLAATKDWQFDKKQLDRWREQWEHLANRHLERHGHEARVDRRSLKDQGIDREPTMHVGYAANEMTARGVPSDRMAELNGILARNELRFDLVTVNAELAMLENEAISERRQQALEAQRVASSAPRRQLQASTPVPQAQRTKSTRRAAMEQEPAEEQQRETAKPVERATAEQSVQQAPAQPTINRVGWSWSAAKGWEKIEDVAAREQQQTAAQKADWQRTQNAPKPSVTQEKPKERQQWGYGTGFVQTSQGYVPLVPIEHVAASQAAAERALAQERIQAEALAKNTQTPAPAITAQNIRTDVRAAQRSEAQLSRAAAQEVDRQRYVENYPYDQSRTRLSTGQQNQQNAWQASVGAQSPERIQPKQIASQVGQQVARGGFRVVNRSTGVVLSLGNFVSNLLASAPREPQPTKINMRTLVTDPKARRQHQLAQHEEAKRRGLDEAVIDDIRRDADAGRDLSAADVSKLSRSHQEQILARGDSYVRELIESSRKRADEYWKGRERERE